MNGAATRHRQQDPTAEIACPHCERSVEVSLPGPDVEPTVRSHVALFGDHSVVHCPQGHRFWVYYC